MSSRWKLAGLAFVCLWFAVGGVGHFLSTDFFVSIVPPYVPFPLAVVYATGVFELLAAVAVWVPASRRVTGLALFFFTLCVTPANIYMSMNPELFHLSQTLLSLRLVVQVLLLACIWWSTREPAPQLRAQGVA